jgi:hypothetical protein
MRFATAKSALTLASVGLFACGAPATAPSPKPTGAKAPESAVSRFFPLIDGTQWAYDAEEDGTGNKGIFVTRARALSSTRFSLVTGQRSRVLEVRPEGITRSETGTYLLRAPLTSGAQWPGESGAVVRISAVDRIVDVPAGKFVGCLDTVEEQRAAGPGGSIGAGAKPAQENDKPLRRVTTTYCPDVGIVMLHAEAWERERHVGERAVLRSFGQPVSL